MIYRTVWRHKTNKVLFATQPYYWQDRVLIIDESKTREVIYDGPASSFDFSDWIKCTHEEVSGVKTHFKEMYRTNVAT